MSGFSWTSMLWTDFTAASKINSCLVETSKLGDHAENRLMDRLKTITVCNVCVTPRRTSVGQRRLKYHLVNQ